MAASTMIKLTPAEATVVESLVTALIPPVSRDEALDVARACGDADPSPERLAALMAGGWSETGPAPEPRPDRRVRGLRRLRGPLREQDVDADGVARDAAETGRCFFADGVKVDHVLRAGGRCVGVRCTRGGVARDVRATKAVVLSGGSLNTPAILLRTPGGFPNDHVGRHLRLHPVTPCASRFDGVDARALSASGLLAIGDGAPMTAACEAHVSGPKGDGYGALIEVPHSGLGIALTACPWLGARDCRELVYGASHLVSALVLQRDVGEGRVRLSAGDREPLVDYALDPRDAASMTEALVTCGRVLAARATSALLSAHQMGTCRMGRSPRDSVVDAAGESWELPGLYVVDASLFPRAGVNPMITTMALAKVVSDGLLARAVAVAAAAVVAAVAVAGR
ncbi:long-chain-alcohol oxidase [Aureococcus anophagefferens]|nr:long-chain-alcohol oxidase [Aureococcus anophagefferens]